MPLRLPPDLLFARGPTIPINDEAVLDLVCMAKKIQSSSGRQHVYESFKKCFCRASGSPYYSSSSEGWAESDLDNAAQGAAGNAPAFINAFVEACDSLQQSGSVVPDHSHISYVLAEHSVPFRIQANELVPESNFVVPPQAPEDAATVAARAFSEASGLASNGRASSAVDRIHTSLHAYLVEVCNKAGIAVQANATTAAVFKLLRENHPSFQHSGSRQGDVNRILQALATVVDALLPVRNKASLAHANHLLDEPEAIVVLNSAHTIFRYVQDSLSRGNAGAI